MRRGFTIIELLVVIAIIGMLASVIAVSLSSVQAKSRDTRRMEDVRELSKALSLYYVDTNNYPQAVTETVLDGSDVVSTTLVNSGAISSIPGDPSPDTSYEYHYQATTTGAYVIRFCLETDSIPGYTQGCTNTLTP